MDNAQRFVVNHTGELVFDPMNTEVSIVSLKITGINVLLEDCNNKGSVQSLNDIPYPRNKDICLIGNKYYYYHKSEWKEAILANNQVSLDVSCPVDALVFYYAAI